MSAPPILDGLTALMMAVATVSAARLAAARRQQRGAVATGIDVAHALMAIAMAGMLAAGFATFPAVVWQAVFWLLTAWFACQAVRDARANGWHALVGEQCAPHLAHSAAMLYMFAALMPPAVGGHAKSGMTGSAMRMLDYPALALAFTLILIGYAVWDLDQIPGRRYSLASAVESPARPGDAALAGLGTALVATGKRPTARMLLLSPGVMVGCRIVMGVTMAFMLATTI